MTVQFLHISKAGGTAIKDAVHRAGSVSSWGPIVLHGHDYKLAQVPKDDHVFFCVRDPVARFVSGFNSRMRKGQPRYYSEWSEEERVAFERFRSPQALASALASEDSAIRVNAVRAMNGIRQLRRHIRGWLVSPEYLEKKLPQVLYIARQETLATDWVQIKEILGLPSDLALPTSAARAHRTDPSLDRQLEGDARRAVESWYAEDYTLLEFCERVRSEMRWGPYRAG